MANRIQKLQLSAFNLRRKVGQLVRLLYVEGPVSYPGDGSVIISSEYSEVVEAYRKPVGRESDHGIKIADQDMVFAWTAIDQNGTPRKKPLLNCWLINQESGESWEITNVKGQGAWSSTYRVICKPSSVSSVAAQVEIDTAATTGVQADISISVTDLLFVRPPVDQVPWGEVELDTDWQTVPLSIFGPPAAGIYGDVRTVCTSTMQAVGLGSIELDLQRSNEVVGTRLWQSVGTGVSQVNGFDTVMETFSDSPPWIPAENRLLYRLRARLLSGYARIYNQEFAIKAEVIIQKTKGHLSLTFTGAELALGPLLVGDLPAGSFLNEIITTIESTFTGVTFSIGTLAEPGIYGELLSAEAGESYVGLIKEAFSGPLYISSTGAVPTDGQSTITLTYF